MKNTPPINIPNSSKVRLAIFGVGMHFQETYSTAFRRNAISDIAEIVWVADLKTKKDIVLERCKIAGQNPIFVGIDSFENDILPLKLSDLLDDQLKKYPVDCVLVSTTPEQHRAYVNWAARHGLDILLDKPISTRSKALFDSDQARAIETDYLAMQRVANENNVLVLINAHRRFHPAYKKVGNLLESIANKTNCGVTMISTFNSDGQWRFPEEMRDITYHGYNTGNGVVSHFGYHYLDTDLYWYVLGTPASKRADAMTVSSRMLSAKEYVNLLPSEDSSQNLVRAQEPPLPFNDEKVLKDISKFGEVDAYVNVELTKNESMTSHISIQMLHSGFSQRAWTLPATNLYKENGRVRWESHLIQQGPYQAIEVRSYQAVQPNWKHPDEHIDRWALGGADHVEINIYRNKILGMPVLETLNARDLLEEIPEHDVIHEDVKAKVLLYFIVLIAKKRKLYVYQKLSTNVVQTVETIAQEHTYNLSLLPSHQNTARLMSASYESNTLLHEKPHLTNRVTKKLIW